MNDQIHDVVRASPPTNEIAPSDSRGLTRIVWHIFTDAEVHPLPRPVVPHDLTMMPASQRIYESVRLAALDCEFSVSPQGHLRAVTKLAIRIALAIGIASLLVAAALACASVAFAVVVTITGQLVLILQNLLMAALLLAALIALGFALLLGVRLATQNR